MPLHIKDRLIAETVFGVFCAMVTVVSKKFGGFFDKCYICV